jgi:hypothetical protein
MLLYLVISQLLDQLDAAFVAAIVAKIKARPADADWRRHL